MAEVPPYVSFWEMDIPSLVDEVVKHENIFAKYKENFREQLLSMNPTFPNKNFYCPITKSDKPLEVEIDNCVISISLDGLLLNNIIHQTLEASVLNPQEQYGLVPKIGRWDNFISGLKKHFSKEQSKGYSIQNVVSDLLNRDDVIEALWSEPPMPYILLGHVKTVQHDSSTGSIQIETRPTLIKPLLDPKYDSLIKHWEYTNHIIQNDKDTKFLGL